MNVHGYKRVAVGLAIVAVIELAAIWKLAWHDTHAMWDVRDARIAVRRIENNRLMALQATPQEAARCLQDVTTCYTPWRWHREDLHLGPFVEERRASAIREIISQMRTATGQDFGEGAESWIQRYASTP